MYIYAFVKKKRHPLMYDDSMDMKSHYKALYVNISYGNFSFKYNLNWNVLFAFVDKFHETKK